MCLYLKEGEDQLLTAEEDITVYKFLKKSIGLDKKFHGKDFTGKIRGMECNGKISTGSEKLFFCTNNHYLDGSFTANKFDFLYSWCIDTRVTEIEVDGVVIIYRGEILPEFAIINYITPYQYCNINVGETYTSNLNRRTISIEEGLHSFATFMGTTSLGEEDCIAECVIPKGSKYYKGTYGGKVSYASNTLKYVKILVNGK